MALNIIGVHTYCMSKKFCQIFQILIERRFNLQLLMARARQYLSSSNEVIRSAKCLKTCLQCVYRFLLKQDNISSTTHVHLLKWYIIREAAIKSYSFSGPTTMALTSPPPLPLELSCYRNTFFSPKIAEVAF